MLTLTFNSFNKHSHIFTNYQYCFLPYFTSAKTEGKVRRSLHGIYVYEFFFIEINFNSMHDNY